MDVVLRIGHVWTFDELAPCTIALDGAVNGPAFDAERRRFSFDHHDGCIRLVTTATCQQVFDALLLGLDPSDCTVLINAVDGDTVLSVWLLRHHVRWREAAAVASVRPLVGCVGAGDAHGPAYPIALPALVEHFRGHVLEPIRGPRLLPGCDTAARVLLGVCLERLETWWHVGLRPAATRALEMVPPRVVDHGTWVFVAARPPIEGRRVATAGWVYAQGWDRAVLYLRLTNGCHQYTLARRSDLVAGFPLDRLYAALNIAEAGAHGRTLDENEKWGGGSSIGGSPRGGGSVLPPDAVVSVIEATLRG